jgi:hypothetical protein
MKIYDLLLIYQYKKIRQNEKEKTLCFNNKEKLLNSKHFKNKTM